MIPSKHNKKVPTHTLRHTLVYHNIPTTSVVTATHSSIHTYNQAFRQQHKTHAISYTKQWTLRAQYNLHGTQHEKSKQTLHTHTQSQRARQSTPPRQQSASLTNISQPNSRQHRQQRVSWWLSHPPTQVCTQPFITKSSAHISWLRQLRLS